MDAHGSDFVGHNCAGRGGRNGVSTVDARASGLLETDGRVGNPSGGVDTSSGCLCWWTLVLLRDGCNGVGHRGLLERDACWSLDARVGDKSGVLLKSDARWRLDACVGDKSGGFLCQWRQEL